ncbi:putative trans-sialidase [Trypanosoma cruzi]|nr:putative trans-sialidase [Trypanosoma cruzi]
MHSRVAAVKAPRTHNRRRVTGSSGRRREGRESEPQRPNISRHLFYSVVLLLLLVMMCCGTGGASSKEKSPAQIPPPKTYFDWRDVKDGETVSSLRVPSLLKVGSDVFAVAEAQCTGKKDTGEGSFTGIASGLLTLTGENPKEELDKTKLKTQVLEECPVEGGNCPSQNAAKEGVSQSETKVHVSRPTTVVEGSDIYMLAGNYSNKGASDDHAGDWGLLLVRGNVSGEERKDKRIYWRDTYGLPWAFFVKQHESLTRLIGSSGSGVKMKDGPFVFPVEGMKNNGKTVSLIIYSSDIASWKLSKKTSADGCSNPSVVEWEKDKLMMMTACDDGRRRVYESGEKGDSWTEALGTLSRVWGDKKGEKVEIVGSGFITATIENKKNVMLATLPVYSKEVDKEDNRKSELHLWLTDNTHIVDIGPVSGEEEAVAASSLLYKSAGGGDTNNEELIALYEKKRGNEESSYGMVSVRLTAQLERVKEVLKTWKKVDERVSSLCPSESAAKDTPPDNVCRSTMPTDGLVGFLSGNFSDNTWSDEYLGVNATVTGAATKAAGPVDGVTFTGRGAGAEWPVGRQGENQLYHFANYNFTLVATVSIDGEPEGDTPIPLMGVKMNGDEGGSKLMEFSYSSEKKWKLLCSGKTTTEHSRTWDPETTHQVAIVLQNEKQGSAYVDGQRVGNAQCEFDNADSKGISHFYIGGDGGSADDTRSQEELSVTVTNVLLYNRPLTDTEIAGLAKNTITIPKPEGPKRSVVDTQSPATSGPDLEGTVSLSNSAGQRPLEEEPLKANFRGDGVSSAAFVATTPSSDAAQAVATGSGDTMRGNGSPQTPEVSVSSGGHGETAGGTDVQGEEEVITQVGDVNATALSSSLGNVSQGNNSDDGTVCGSGLLPSLLLLLLGLWGFAAL